MPPWFLPFRNLPVSIATSPLLLSSSPCCSLLYTHQASFSSSSTSARKTLLCLIKSSSRKDNLPQIHARIIRASLIDEPTILAAFSTSAASLNAKYLRQFFLFHVPNPSLSLYNAVIRRCSKSSEPEEAFFFYVLMHAQGVRPDPFTCSFIVESCARTASLIGGRQVHACILRDGLQWDCPLLTSLMKLYSDFGVGDSARRLFDEMPHRDTVAWNVLISSYAQNRRTKDALGLFDEMQTRPDGSEPDDVTCLLLLQASAHLGALEFGRQIHGYIDDHGYGNAPNLCNSLVAMYSKCGSVGEAVHVFDRMPERSVVSWSTMISGFAMNGHGREAINAFREMQSAGVKPDNQTFTGVLSACSHNGFVDEGLRIFDMMTMEFGLVPNAYHYGCVVDLLGRAGLLDQAYHLIISMAVEPDATVWRTLLGACRIHGHIPLGERVVGHLIELKAQEAGDYILLLNIYSGAGDWKKVGVLRKMMKDKGIQTTPGCSTIILKGVVHEFVVDDDSHPRKEEIYAKLDEIGKQLKIAGYIPDMSAELHDIDEEGKGDLLSFHSEKLALALGMVATPPGTTIRVTKNLRICVDCHTFAKFISSVYGRMLIIRDRSRFHHFREGFCSCNDYW